MGLDEHATRLVPAAGPARDLLDLLEASLRSAKVAALQAKIGIDHSNQGEVGEVIALGHELGADHDVEFARFHRPDEFRGPRRRPDGVAGHDRCASPRKEVRDLVGNPLDPWAASDEAVLLAALGAKLGRRHDVAAMVAGKPLHQPMFDHPGRTVRTLKAVTAGSAQR